MYDGVLPQTEKPHNFNKCGIFKKRKAELNSKQINLYFSIQYSMFGGSVLCQSCGRKLLNIY